MSWEEMQGVFSLSVCATLSFPTKFSVGRAQTSFTFVHFKRISYFSRFLILNLETWNNQFTGSTMSGRAISSSYICLFLFAVLLPCQAADSSSGFSISDFLAILSSIHIAGTIASCAAVYAHRWGPVETEMKEIRKDAKSKMEKMRTDMETKMEKMRTDMETKMEKMRTDMETKAKADLEEMKRAMDANMEKMRTDMETKMEKMRTDMETKMEKMRTDMETKAKADLEEMKRAMDANMEKMRTDMETKAKADLEGMKKALDLDGTKLAEEVNAMKRDVDGMKKTMEKLETEMQKANGDFKNRVDNRLAVKLYNELTPLRVQLGNLEGRVNEQRIQLARINQQRTSALAQQQQPASAVGGGVGALPMDPR